MVRFLSDDDVAAVLDLESLLPVLEEAFVKQGRGEVERPERPHYPIGRGLVGDDPLGTALTMPAYVHGATYFATKLASVHEGNAERGLPTVNATIALADAETGLPAAYMAGTRVTNARTGCIGGLAAAHLAASEPVTLGVVGAGTQARWQTRAIAAATDVERVSVYSPSDSREACAAALREEGLEATAVDSPEAALAGSSVVVTATTSIDPVFDGDALEPGTLVVAVGAYTPSMRELDARTIERAARVFADVPEEAVTVGDLAAVGFEVEDLHPLSAVFEGEVGRATADEILVVDSVGSAVLDAAAAEQLLDRASEADVGTTIPL
ncbi:alanine dehydrogenase [Halogranum amylolyticum]|uniref:Alanine dehydrogenase n=1 Tax=Halogranum amylolyticum TaxID=660520 RepID=A0A1H8SFH7_9EURY|nr:ornithine cyclodeaminase family protein [Halogranum amylolyticum]SEO77307.1 alanine dehydrogenase [Halogranum amylolyticum]